MAILFGVKVPAINKHLRNIFDSGELDENSVISILETTAMDDINYHSQCYNLDAKLKAQQEYEVYRKQQDSEFISDFDRSIKRVKGINKLMV